MVCISNFQYKHSRSYYLATCCEAWSRLVLLCDYHFGREELVDAKIDENRLTSFSTSIKGVASFVFGDYIA